MASTRFFSRILKEGEQAIDGSVSPCLIEIDEEGKHSSKRLVLLKKNPTVGDIHLLQQLAGVEIVIDGEEAVYRVI